MEVREAILERIKAIRKDEGVTICPEQNVKQEEKLSEFRMEIMSILLKLVDSEAANLDNLKEISSQLLRFRSTISDEVMRLLMLPQPKCGDKKPKKASECTECDPLKKLSDKVEKLVECSGKKDEEGEEEVAEEVEQVEQEEAEEEEEEECLSPVMYAMELGVNGYYKHTL